jgi:hypothetical protein
LVLFTSAPAAHAVQVVENEFFTATLPSKWEVRSHSDPPSRSMGRLSARVPQGGNFFLTVRTKTARSTIDTTFLGSYEGLSRRGKVEQEVSIDQMSHRKGVGLKLVSLLERERVSVVTIHRLFVWEESGRICSVQATVSGRTREETEQRYAQCIGLWEDTVGALAIHPPSPGS